MEKVEIGIKGRIDKNWSDCLDGLDIAYTGDGQTVLTGSVRDQSALLGLLNRLSGLGLQLASLMSRRADASGEVISEEVRRM